ncbi:MAG: prepilin-type N-terminal cleavage/methylation domain-containing protein [Candidatus Wildermuthbacteria bacterium]|nr:prepilin-type N-terminal cleavage/methylation domain-containing protein [Candidatus Wildermuthbacteria bacterium]
MACFQRFNATGGFTLVEILVVLAIFAFLLGSSVVALSVLRGDTDLQAEARGFQRVLELARNKTIASEGDTRHGVYVNAAVSQYVLFQGDDYASGVSEEVFQLRDTVEFGAVSFAGGQEVVFDRIQGTTSNVGSVTLQTKTDPSNSRTVYVESSGAVAIDSSGPLSGGDCDSAVPPGDRVCDSRHVHIDYVGRAIDTASEEIILDFGATTETIVINDNVSGGQIVWEGIVTVDGEDQKLKIHTHVLNDVGWVTQFSIHRDRRFNTKPLTITVPGTVADPDSGTLIQYDGAGNVTQGTSAYVTTTTIQ